MREHMKRFALSLTVLGAWATTGPSAAAQGNATNWPGSGTVLHGVPPSVTSFGFGGQRGFHGVPPSVTSPNFGSSSFHFNQGPVFFQHRNRLGHRGRFLGDVVAVPYAYPVYVAEPGVDDSMEEPDYRGGPTIFDRRGSGADDYPGWRASSSWKERDEPQDYRSQQNPNQLKEDNVANQVSTVLVFKDGHRLEVQNYAIVGVTLFDLSDGRTRKVALAELDLSATVKQNDDRGVDFQIPRVARLN